MATSDIPALMWHLRAELLRKISGNALPQHGRITVRRLHDDVRRPLQG